MPSRPAARALASWPLPMARATAGVVEYARNTMSPTAVCRTADASPTPASSATPRWPTMAESASRNSGSAISAPKAGTARRRISRRCPVDGGRVVDSGGEGCTA